MDPVVDLLAFCRVKGVSWYFVAREAQRPRGIERLRSLASSEATVEARTSLEVLKRAGVRTLAENRAVVRDMLDKAASDSIRLTTILDNDYPVNLRTVYNLPPFLFYRGELRGEDAFSVAVVGTREPSRDGIQRARRMASLLARANVTVLSGLARGIDTAAHEACLEAGGRTIAVLGSGIRRIYPPEAGELADRITRAGALRDLSDPTDIERLAEGYGGRWRL